jgi:hypothetical protein
VNEAGQVTDGEVPPAVEVGGVEDVERDAHVECECNVVAREMWHC